MGLEVQLSYIFWKVIVNNYDDHIKENFEITYF